MSAAAAGSKPAIFFGSFVVTAQVCPRAPIPQKHSLTLRQGLSSYTSFIRLRQLETLAPGACSRVP